MHRINRWVLVLVIVLGIATVSADDPSEQGRLRLVESLPETISDGAPGNELGAVDVSISPDGRFADVPTKDKKAISVFRRGPGD